MKPRSCSMPITADQNRRRGFSPCSLSQGKYGTCELTVETKEHALFS